MTTPERRLGQTEWRRKNRDSARSNTTPAPVRPLRDPRREKLNRVYEEALEAFLYPGVTLGDVQCEVAAAYVESKGGNDELLPTRRKRC